MRVHKEVSEMPAMQIEAKRGRRKVFLAVLLLVGLATCLTACRGFFGQAPIAVLVVTPTTDEEVPVAGHVHVSHSNDPDGTITELRPRLR